MKNFKSYIFIIFFSLVFFLYLSEAYLTFFLYKGGEGRLDPNLKQKQTIYKNLTGKNYETRTKMQFYEYNKKFDQNTSVTIEPYFLSSEKSFYLGGVSKTNTVDCNENGYYSIHLTDRYGFNNIDKEWDSKEIEYLLIGDSFVHGACVDRPHDVSSRLREISNRSVLNLGYRGNGPLTQYASLREYMPKKVKNVLWFYFEENDISDIKLEMKTHNLTKYLDDKNFNLNLMLKQKQIDKFHKKRIEKDIIEKKRLDKYWDSYYSTKKKILRFVRLNQSKQFFYSFKNKKISNNDDFALKKFEETLVAAKELSDKNGSKFYFIYLGAYHRYKSSFGTHKYKDYYPKIIKIVNKLGIPVIDTTKESFLKNDDPLIYFPFRQYGHYNVEGYKKLSELIYKKVN